MELTGKQLEELRLGALTAIDGLWFMAAERKLGFEAALELDLEVWKDYGVVMLRRIARAAGLEIDPANPPGMAAVNDLIATVCRIDGTRCSWEMQGENESIFRVHHCSWWENLCRSGREKTVPCEMIDNIIFPHWLKAIDPTIDMEIVRSLPRGDGHCAWTYTRRPVGSG